MKTALIILNYNSYNDLVSLVNRLLLITNRATHSIFVIDGNSTVDKERSKEFIMASNGIDVSENYNIPEINKESSLYYMQLTVNNGYAYGNNVGLRLSYELGYDYAFVINPDVFIPNKFIFEDAVNVFTQNNKIGILGYKVLAPEGHCVGPFKYKLGWESTLRVLFFPMYSLIRQLKWQIERKYKGYITVNAVMGCFLGFNLSKLHEAEYYDEYTFLYFEEYIISERMRRAGYSTVYRDAYYVVHDHLTVDKTDKFNKYVERNKQYFIDEYIKPSMFLLKFMKLRSYFRVRLLKLRNR